MAFCHPTSFTRRSHTIMPLAGSDRKILLLKDVQPRLNGKNSKVIKTESEQPKELADDYWQAYESLKK
jgi:hypothetical protein